MSYNSRHNKAIGDQIGEQYKTPNENNSIIISFSFNISKTS